MFETPSCNMTKTDASIRAAVAVLLTVIALIVHSYMLGTVALVLLVTAYSRFCLIYRLLRLNQRFSTENHYLSLLPEYNTSPVFIFDNTTRRVLFKNKFAKNLDRFIAIRDRYRDV